MLTLTIKLNERENHSFLQHLTTEFKSCVMRAQLSLTRPSRLGRGCEKSCSANVKTIDKSAGRSDMIAALLAGQAIANSNECQETSVFQSTVLLQQQLGWFRGQQRLLTCRHQLGCERVRVLWMDGAAHALGLHAYMHDFGVSLLLVIESDSTSAKPLARRRALVKQRHAQTRYSWIHDMVAANNFVIKKYRQRTTSVTR